MRKGRDEGKKAGWEKNLMKIVATTSLLAVNCPNANCGNAKIDMVLFSIVPQDLIFV